MSDTKIEKWIEAAIEDYCRRRVPEEHNRKTFLLELLARHYAAREVPKDAGDWKSWHRQIAEVLGLAVVERSVTLDEIQKLKREAEAWTGINDFSSKAGQPGKDAVEIAERIRKDFRCLPHLEELIAAEIAPLADLSDDAKACRAFAAGLPAGRSFVEFGGSVAGRLYVLREERDDLRERIAASLVRETQAQTERDAARKQLSTQEKSGINKDYVCMNCDMWVIAPKTVEQDTTRKGQCPWCAVRRLRERLRKAKEERDG